MFDRILVSQNHGSTCSETHPTMKPSDIIVLRQRPKREEPTDGQTNTDITKSAPIPLQNINNRTGYVKKRTHQGLVLLPHSVSSRQVRHR